jgi:glutamyl-tRNA reductase
MHCLRVGVIGINFKTADLHVREAIARGAQSLQGMRAIFFRHPVVVLSTCNRTEIYFSGEDLASAHSDILAHLRTQIEEPFEHKLYSYFGVDAFAHLCLVASGLDSAIVAETEIQRQVKVAYGRTCEQFQLPGCLHYVFQKALKVGKWMRNQGKSGAPSLYKTLWQLADWKRILLVGYSEINRGFASFLEHKGVRDYVFCTRQPREGMVDRSVLNRWQEFNVIVCASTADGYLITGQGERRHTLFDLSVPRNIDPEVGNVARLYNIDQLMPEEHRYLEQCEALLWGQVLHLARIYRTKTQRALGNEGMGLHPECSPCRLRREQAAQSQDQSRHGEPFRILAAQDTTSSLLA